MALDEGMKERAVSFGSVADDYDRLRPGYPAALFDDLLAAAGPRIGAGSWRSAPGLAWPLSRSCAAA